MNNSNFLSKTLKTFLTSLFVSVFIFGSLYFFLSDNTTSQSDSNDVKGKASSYSEKSKKLVVEEEIEEEDKLSETVAKQTESDRQVLGATTDTYIAQIPGATDYTSPFQNEVTTTTPATTPPVVITGTLPSNLTMAGSTVYATGVPKTGNESLYIILGLFSTIAGFLITSGKAFAMKDFERM